MAGSSRAINYSVRPCKQVERKMICSLLLAFQRLAQLEAYQYVGFGARYFRDFALVHRHLGIQDMISIESDITNPERYKYNLPYSCIKLEFGHSNQILPLLDFSKPTIIWLDYDGPVDSSVLADVATFVSQAAVGSFFFITLNAHPRPRSGNLRDLIRKVGRDKVRRDLTDGDLMEWGLAQVSKDLVDAVVSNKLSLRNVGKSAEERTTYEQLCSFIYQDSARMVSFGGVLCNTEWSGFIEAGSLDGLGFVRHEGQAPFEIRVPNLSYKEILTISGLCPVGSEAGEVNFIPAEELHDFDRIHRWFPILSETEL